MMTTRNLGPRTKPARLSGETVSVEVAEPYAVYWAGEQRTGTIDDVPVEVATYWLRRRWASYIFGDEVGASGPPPRSGVGGGRDSWAAYAAAQGITVDDNWKRDDIIAAVDKAAGQQ